MAEHIVTSGQSTEKDPIVDRYSQVLIENGYTVLNESVHGKNQTRFLHFILEKDGTKYFSKANRHNLHDTHMNASLVRRIKNPPEGVKFLAPLEELENGDVIYHIYPYVDQEPVSNESKEFSDFNVDEADIDLFLSKVLAAIECVESQTGLVTNLERNRDEKVGNVVLNLLKKMPNDTPYAVEFLKHMLSEKDHLNEYRTAITDIQVQNMFWNKKDKTLTVFDMDFIGPKRRYYDHSKFIASLWVVYGQPAYAKRFTEMVFDSVPSEEAGKVYRYMRFNLSEESLISYGVFTDVQTRTRIEEFMQWIRRDLLRTANSE